MCWLWVVLQEVGRWNSTTGEKSFSNRASRAYLWVAMQRLRQHFCSECSRLMVIPWWRITVPWNSVGEIYACSLPRHGGPAPTIFHPPSSRIATGTGLIFLITLSWCFFQKTFYSSMIDINVILSWNFEIYKLNEIIGM